MARPVPIAVLISGSGTNLQAIIDAVEAQRLDAKIQLVLSNRAEAYGLVRAKNHGIPVEVLDHKRFPIREAFDQAVDDILRAHDVELAVLVDAQDPKNGIQVRICCMRFGRRGSFFAFRRRGGEASTTARCRRLAGDEAPA